MQRLTASFLLLALACLAHLAPAMAQENGRDYLTLPSPQPVDAGNKVEVTEFFFYTCPYCAAFDPVLAQWVKKQGDRIVFKRVHLDMHNSTQLQRMYYALEAMGQLEPVHARIFRAVHVEHRMIRSDADALKLAADLGIDARKFDSVYRSFAIQGKVTRAAQLMNAYRVTGVPTIAVGGRYLTSPAQMYEAKRGIPPARLNEAVLPVLDHLVDKVRREKGLK